MNRLPNNHLESGFEKHQPNKIFINNLPNCSDDLFCKLEFELGIYFSFFGKILNKKIIRNSFLKRT